MIVPTPYDLPCRRMELNVVHITFPANASTVFAPIYRGEVLRNVAAVYPAFRACGPAAPDGTPFINDGETILRGYFSVFNLSQRPVIQDGNLDFFGLNGLGSPGFTPNSVPWMFEQPIDIDLRLSRVQVNRSGNPVERVAMAFLFLFAA